VSDTSATCQSVSPGPITQVATEDERWGAGTGGSGGTRATGGAGLTGPRSRIVIGAVTAITFAWRPAFGLGLSIAYALWSVFLLIDLARTGIDQEALKERFYPSRTIDTTKETLEWLQKRMPRENES